MKRRHFNARFGHVMACHLRHFGGGSSTQQTSSTSTTALDNRQAVDSGVIANSGASVDMSTNTTDNRDLSDHSNFNVANSGNTTTTDNRDLSDHSSFSVANSGNTTTTNNTTTTDSRDLSDHSSFSSSYSDTSTTNIQAADAEVLKQTAARAFESLNGLSSDANKSALAALKFGDDVNDRSVDAVAATAREFAGIASKSLELASSATTLVSENAKSSDQLSTEKLIKAGTVVAVVGLGVAAIRAFRHG